MPLHIYSKKKIRFLSFFSQLHFYAIVQFNIHRNYRKQNFITMSDSQAVIKSLSSYIKPLHHLQAEEIYGLYQSLNENIPILTHNTKTVALMVQIIEKTPFHTIPLHCNACFGSQVIVISSNSDQFSGIPPLVYFLYPKKKQLFTKIV